MTGVLLASAAGAAALLAGSPALVASVGGPEDAPAYLAVHAAAALGTFEAEGVRVTLRRAKHAAAAIDALREDEAAVAVTTADQAVRGAWARGTPVRILVAHTRAPAVVLLVSAKHRDRVVRVEDLRGTRVGIPGPGTTGHLVLAALLRARRIEPWQLELLSFGGTTVMARLGSGELAAAALEEPWATRAVAAGVGSVLVDVRRAEDATRQLGGPFYEVVSVARADERELAALEPALGAYVRAVIRVQAWLAAAPPAEIADRLSPRLVRDRDRFVAWLGAVQSAYSPDGDATEAGLATTLAVLRAGSPWPVTLKITPQALREPPFLTAVRAGLNPGSRP